MRRYLFPMTLMSAIGAVVVVLVIANRNAPDRPDEDTPEAGRTPAKKTGSHWQDERRNTKTSLRDNQALSELERALQRKDLSNAYLFRHKVAEQIEEILQSETLKRNLLEAIRKHGTESSDKKRRELMLPFLRIVRDPEATEMIRSEYYKTSDPTERLLLLEAMAQKYHDPETATVWASDQALNAGTQMQRERAFEAIEKFSNSKPLLYRTARTVFEGTTRPEQGLYMLYQITLLGDPIPEAAEYLRRRLKQPKAEEVAVIAKGIAAWGTERDAAHLEALAVEFPAMGDQLREQAEQVRSAIRMKKHGDDQEAAMAEAERRRKLEEEREKERKKKAEQDG